MQYTADKAGREKKLTPDISDCSQLFCCFADQSFRFLPADARVRNGKFGTGSDARLKFLAAFPEPAFQHDSGNRFFSVAALPDHVPEHNMLLSRVFA